MSQPKVRGVPATKRQTEMTTDNGNPLLIIHNVNSELDINGMVDLLYSKNEFNGNSSLFLVVSTSDGEDDESPVSLRAQCVLSENQCQWKNNDGQKYNLPRTRTISKTEGVKLCSRGKTTANQVPVGTVSASHIEICSHYIHTPGQNQFCQVTSTEKYQVKRVISTDTTVDRPCCCDTVNSQDSSETDVVSDLIIPIFAKEGYGPHETIMYPNNYRQPSSSTEKPSHSTQCFYRRPDYYQMSVPTPMKIPAVGFPKESSSYNAEEPTPIFYWNDTKDATCGVSAPCSTCMKDREQYKPRCGRKFCKEDAQSYTEEQCSNGCQYDTRDVPLPSRREPDEQLIPIIDQPVPLSLGAPQNPVATGIQGGTGGLKIPRSKLKGPPNTRPPMGFYGQPPTQREPDKIKIIGPDGGFVLTDTGGICTQAGETRTRYNIGTCTGECWQNATDECNKKKESNCECKNEKKRKKKKKNKVICECPPPEPGSEPEPGFNLLDYMKDHHKSFLQFQDSERKKKYINQSELTQTTTGFKVNKKKKPPEDDNDLDNLIRDYARLKPDLFMDLLPPGLKDDCSCNEEDKKAALNDCECPVEPEEPPKEEPLKGLKFTIGGKGSGSKGLSGICCFEMIHEW